MNITIEVMLPPRGTSDWTVPCNPVFQVLAPVAVYARKSPPSIGMRCTGYLHCAEVPEHPTWPVDWTLERKLVLINERLTAMIVDGEFNVADNRLWAGNVNALNTPTRNALRTDRQVEISWNTLKAVFSNKGHGGNLTEADFAYTP